MKPNKIAIVAEWLTSRGGAENVIFELVKMFPDADIFTTVFNKTLYPEFKGRTVITSFLQNIPIINKRHQLAFFLLPKAIESLDVSGYDLVISSSSAFGKGIKKDKDALHICYCHTPMRWVWEPERDSRISRLPFSRYIQRRLKAWDQKTNKGVDLFLANSEYTASKIKKFYNRTPEILYPPVDVKSFNKTSTTGNGEYYFSISRLIPYKRIDIAIKACEMLGKKLLVAGSGPEDRNLKQIAGKNTTFLGRIDSADKQKYYANAKATIFCADEDFGIVPVESIASGTPVISYKKGGALEVVKEGINGVSFKEQTPGSLAESIRAFEKLSFNTNNLKQSVMKFDKIEFRNNLNNIINKLRSQHGS